MLALHVCLLLHRAARIEIHGYDEELGKVKMPREDHFERYHPGPESLARAQGACGRWGVLCLLHRYPAE